MTIFEVPLFDEDFYKLLFRFGINIFFLTIIIRFLYFKKTQNKEFLFTYYMISVIVFFICFTLKKLELDLGMALGLFAIFGIIRYRTNTVSIKEMTYLFVVIGVSVINALANKKLSYAELVLTNSIIVLTLYLTESFSNHGVLLSKKITYSNIENLKPENREELIAELEQINGIKISDVKIGSVDLNLNTATIKILYEDNE
ncbi:DUF4956 domain-containing protein [uncultured Polaribacter sp.]|mgnify:FL=1|uniref:DUF4956 domain-containing protein n=1 Tax=uncultured Polaribacter sp. TaxID=174711 RepID=UPI0030D980A1|tara:strand:+ start:4080 stop:4682 length:603 start_codon:yes stop_codon:yes gene_type:complete